MKTKQNCLIGLALLIVTNVFAQKQEIHILAVNDMHAAIEAFPKVAAIADSLRTLYPSLLVFSAGDNRTGNPLSDMYEVASYPMVALMNQVGFNATAIGNHDFDEKSLSPVMALSNFSYICANMFPSPDIGMRNIPTQVFDIDGLKVGVIGVVQVAKTGLTDTHPRNLEGISFTQPENVIGQYKSFSEKCNVTILLSHIGYESDIEMAERFPWLDLIIGGHSHTQLTANEPLHNGVLITQNENRLPKVTHISLTLNNGKLTDKKAEYIDVKAFSKKNKTVEEMVNYFCDGPTLKTEFITDVTLIAHNDKTEKDKLIASYKEQGWTLINKDLNEGAGGDYTYLLYKSAENNDGHNDGLITNFYIMQGASNVNPSLTHNGHTYHLVTYDGSEQFKSQKGNLNCGTSPSSDAIHLYYTKEIFPDNRAIRFIWFDSGKDGALGKNGDSDAYDLNNGTGSVCEDIYMHITRLMAIVPPAVNYISYSYDATNGLKRTDMTSTDHKAVTRNHTEWKNETQVLTSNVIFDKRITISGTVNLILCDGCTLEANKGIEVAKGHTLNIYAQSDGSNIGVLKAITTLSNAAGIGGGHDEVSGGTVNIHGGKIESTGGLYGAGIGGGAFGNGGNVTVYGGTVKAFNGGNAAGIGGGLSGSGGTVTICGGMVVAEGGDGAMGIGFGGNGVSETDKSPGTLEIGRGITVYGDNNNSNPTGNGARGPVDNVEKHYRYMRTTTIPTYEMKFVLGNGSTDIVKYQEVGTSLTAPSDFSREGYEFTGWDPTVPSTVPAEDNTFTAQWRFIIEGDTNGDNEVNVADIVKLINDGAPQADIDAEVNIIMTTIKGDVNGDSQVNVADIVKLVNDNAPQADIDTEVNIIMKK